LVNGELRGRGLCRTRRGQSRVVFKAETGTAQGAIFYEPAAGNGVIVYVQNGKVWYWGNSGTAPTQLGSVQLTNQTLPVQFLVSKDSGGKKLFLLSGENDPSYAIDMNAVTITPQGISTADFPRGNIGTTQSKRAIIAGNPALNDSVILGPIVTGLLHSGDGQWDHNVNNLALDTLANEYVTALAKYREDQVLAFTRNSAHYLGNLSDSDPDNWFVKVIDPTYGTEAPLSVVVSGQDAFFLSPDQQLRTISRSELAAIKGVDETVSYYNTGLFGRINQAYSKYAAAVDFDDYILLAVPVDGSTTNNLVIVVDKKFMIQSPEGYQMPAVIGEWTGMNVQSWIPTNFGGRKRLHYLSVDGDIYEMFAGEADGNGWGLNTYPELQVDFRGMEFGSGDIAKKPHFGEVRWEQSFGTMSVYYAGDDRTFESTPLRTFTIDASNPTFAVTFPIAFGGPIDGSGKFFFDGKPRSRMIQIRITGEDGPIDLRELTVFAKTYNVNKRE